MFFAGTSVRRGVEAEPVQGGAEARADGRGEDPRVVGPLGPHRDGGAADDRGHDADGVRAAWRQRRGSGAAAGDVR